MAEPPGSIIEEREELVVSSTGDAKPTKRTAHFLKPSLTSINGPFLELPSHFLPSVTTASEPIKRPKVSFNGWRFRQRGWKPWLDRMHSLHQSTWKKAGIYEAIMGSTYEIRRDNDLVFGIAERWCSDTNTFIFPWGEATITLEDVMILGGYSVMGDSVLSPLEESRELKETQEKLLESRLQITRSKAQKACQQRWMKHFMDNESECEHEAFLSLWLSRFVVAKDSFNTISKFFFPIAIHLARGKQIALAPVVLASIYRDLSLLKEQVIVASNKLGASKDNGDVLALTLWSPFQLVQIWVWERFVAFRPMPNLIKNGEPRLARWSKVKMLKVENVRLALDSAGECFQWRPYTSAVNNWVFPKFYREKEGCVSIDLDLDRDLVSFARCLRVCELVGLDCIEQYQPHRVAMQFGMDQDIPVQVVRYNETPEIAWKSYNRPISDAKLYIPSRFFESDVTTRYLAWWKQSFLGQQDSVKGVVWKQGSPKHSKSLPESSKDKKGDNDAKVPPGFKPKNIVMDTGAAVPPSFPPRVIMVDEGDSDEEDKLTISEFLKSNKKHNRVGSKLADDGRPLLGTQSQCQSSSLADDGTITKMESTMEPGEKIIHGEASMEGQNRVMEDKNESKARSPVSDKENEGENNSSGTPESFRNIDGYKLPTFCNVSHLELSLFKGSYGWRMLSEFLESSSNLQVLVLTKICGGIDVPEYWTPPQPHGN